MIKVALARRIGFCFGVKRAIEMAERELKRNSKIYSLGSIIHNRQVVGALSKSGLKVIKNIGVARGGTIVISSHGLSPKTVKAIAKKGMRVVDTTCPFVRKAQGIAKDLSDAGYDVIIVGDVGHPEVKALVDFVSTRAFVVKDKKEAAALKLKRSEKAGVISQTTQSMANFFEVARKILKKRPKEIRIFNTICKDAEERQGAARELAGEVDVMLIVGGRESANTKRLFEVCKHIIKDSYLVETEKDLKRVWFKDKEVVGITSGASTPEWVIKRVADKINRSNPAKHAVYKTKRS